MIPTSNFRMCKTKLHDISNVLTFSDKGAQTSYFHSHCTVKAFNDFTYIRTNNSVRIPDVADKYYNCNYCCFNNANFGSKWFYAYITDVKYISPECTEVQFEIDPFQTYQFDITFGASFVEREHIAVSDDIAGNHTLSEPVPCGNYKDTVYNFNITDPTLMPKYLIGARKNLNGDDLGACEFNGAQFACGVYIANNSAQLNNLVAKLEHVQSGNVLFVQAVSGFSASNIATDGDGLVTMQLSSSMAKRDVGFEIADNLNGYTPRNNKLLTYPYRYITVSSRNGDVMEYPIEKFSTVHFREYHECNCGAQIVCVPCDYENNSECWDKKVATTQFPSVPFQNDNSEYYQTAKAFQSANQALSIYNSVSSFNPTSVVGALHSAGGLVSQGISMAIENAKLNDTASRNSRTYNGSSTSGVLYGLGLMGFKYAVTAISEEYAKIADDYLDRFGYSVLRTKKPNLNNRPNWNYVKTVGCSISGNAPKRMIDKIAQAFDNGITLWHNASSMYDYSKNNR